MSIMERHNEERYEAAIEGMLATPRYIADFIVDGAELDAVVLLLLSRGLPLHDRTSRDDGLIDRYDGQITQLRDAFVAFAREKPLGQQLSRIDAYIESNRLEYAA